MESHYSNGSYSYGDPQAGHTSHYSYPHQQPSSYASLPNIRSQYDHHQQSQQPQQHQHQHQQQPSQQQQQQTLPPLQPQQRPSGSSGSLFDHYNGGRTQAGYPSAAANQLTSGYATSGPFGGQFANYSHDSLMPQQPQGYGMHHESGNPSYLNDIRSSNGFGLSGQTLPPLPSTQPYGQSFGGAYEQPSHVVGAQGRRGILPSDDGRPSAVAPDGIGAARTNMVPQKDQDGKFPCPHCQKTYLHAKHLKRHLLRHTGDRPYSCFLCNDTFSRSDILKRHFQKCSIRRGNPTGASHLQNSQSHLRKQAAKRTSNELSGKPGSSHDGSKSQPDSETNSLYSATTSRPASDNFSSLRSDGRTDSSITSISTMSTPVREKTRSMTGPVPLTSIKAEPISSQPVTPALPTGSTAIAEAPYSAHDIAGHGFAQRDSNSAAYRDNSSIATLASPSDGASDFGWSGLHAQQGQSDVDFVHPYFHVGANDADLLNADNHFNTWQFTQQNAVSYHDVAARLISYLQLDAQVSTESHVVRNLLSTENVEQFLTKYLNFHQHWPNLHMPTFHPLTSYPGIVLAMCTVGAAYSERVVLADVRTLLRMVKTHIFNVSEAGRAAREPMMDVSGLIDNQEVFEQLAALGILTKMVLWHSDPEHRVMLNSDHGGICQLVKRLSMLEPLPRTVPGFSELHQPDAQVHAVGPNNFDYAAWLRQEKRSRAAYIVLQADMAHFLYFNTAPNFTVEEVKLPLPADDAAWEAHNGNDCATALGLHGSEAQESLNIAGSRRIKQVEFHQAMKVLAHPTQGFMPRSTNAYGKFMLVHGIHVQIWHAQHQQRPTDFFGGPQVGNMGTAAPLSPADWISSTASLPPSSIPNSGHATPTSDGGATAGTLQALDRQLLKWRRAYDEDDVLEYSPDTPHPRVGFCRDGKPFFWLGRMLLKNMHLMDPNAPWQKRFATMMAALKQSKAISQNEGLSAGLGLSMAADTIDPQYGVDDLTLDMKLLFSPISPADSPAVRPGTFAHMAA